MFAKDNFYIGYGPNIIFFLHDKNYEKYYIEVSVFMMYSVEKKHDNIAYSSQPSNKLYSSLLFATEYKQNKSL